MVKIYFNHILIRISGDLCFAERIVRTLMRSGHVTRNPGSGYVEKVSKYWVFSELAYFWPFLTGMLAELTIRSVEIEPHIVLL